jgi:hypothetical protein
MIKEKPMLRRGTGAVKSTVSAALCAALVLLSPGLECYAVVGDVVRIQTTDAGSPRGPLGQGRGSSLQTAPASMPLSPAALSGTSWVAPSPPSVSEGPRSQTGVVAPVLPLAGEVETLSVSGGKVAAADVSASAPGGKLAAAEVSAPAGSVAGLPGLLAAHEAEPARTPRAGASVKAFLQTGVRRIAQATGLSGRKLAVDAVFAERGTPAVVEAPAAVEAGAPRAAARSGLLGSAGTREAVETPAQVPTPEKASASRVTGFFGAVWKQVKSDTKDLLSGEPARVGRGWANWTNHMVAIAGGIFSVAQFPQIFKNFGNLSAGRPKELQGLPPAGYSSGTLANMTLLGYFRSMGEIWTAISQAMSVLSNAIVITQIFMAGFMPPVAYALVMAGVAAGALINWFDHKGGLPKSLFKGGQLPKKVFDVWSKMLGILAMTVLPWVLWTTFAPYFVAAAKAASLLPLAVAGPVALAMFFLNEFDKLPKRMKAVWNVAGAWSATILFGYGPVAMHAYYLKNPAGLTGMSGIGLLSFFLNLLGNTLLLPRMMYSKNTIGTVGNLWMVYVGAIGCLAWMFAFGFFPGWLFWPLTLGVTAFLLFSRWMNHRYPAAKT